MEDFPRGGARGIRAPLFTTVVVIGGRKHAAPRLLREALGRQLPAARVLRLADAFPVIDAARLREGYEPPDYWGRRGRYGKRPRSKLARALMTSLGVRNTTRPEWIGPLLKVKKVKPRAEHIEEARRRALEILDAGGAFEAFAYFAGELKKHPQIAADIDAEVSVALLESRVGSAERVREFIEEFK